MSPLILGRLSPLLYPSGPTTIASDNYTRADQDPLSGSTPVGAKVYTVYVISGAFTGAGVKIVSNGLQAKDAGVDGCVIDAGTATFSASVALKGTPSGGGEWVRGSDSANGYKVYWDGTNVIIQKIASGSPTTLDSQPVSWAAGDVLKVTCSGNVITAYKNNVQVATATDAFNNTATLVGPLANGSTAVVLDDFLVTTP